METGWCFVFSHLICSVDICGHMALRAKHTESLLPRAPQPQKEGKKDMNDTARQGKRENEWGDAKHSRRVIRSA